MNERLVLDAVTERPPRRMKQPTKDTIRGWLRSAEARAAQLQTEVRDLRAEQLHPDERTRLVTDLVHAAAALGHHKTLRSSSDRTINHWQARVDALAAALKGEQHGR